MARKSRRTGARAAREREMRAVVRDLRASGLSQREFCSRRGIAESTLAWWRRELEGKPGSPSRAPKCVRQGGASAFLPVEVVSDDCGRGASRLEIVLPGGAIIHMASDACEAELRRVFQALGSTC